MVLMSQHHKRAVPGNYLSSVNIQLASRNTKQEEPAALPMEIV